MAKFTNYQCNDIISNVQQGTINLLENSFVNIYLYIYF